MKALNIKDGEAAKFIENLFRHEIVLTEGQLETIAKISRELNVPPKKLIVDVINNARIEAAKNGAPIPVIVDKVVETLASMYIGAAKATVKLAEA